MRFLLRNINEANKMEYLIVFGVASMIGLYVLIIGRYLRDA